MSKSATKKTVSKKIEYYSEEESEEKESEEESEEKESEEESEEENSKEETSDNYLDEENIEDIRNISLETIDSSGYFGTGNYGDFKVYIMLKDVPEKNYKKGFMNATKLCQTANKKFYNWTPSDFAKELIEEIETSPGYKGDAIIVIKGGNKNESYKRGTYVDPKLMPHIASWISASFALKVSQIVNEYLAKEVIDEKEKLLKKKDDKIDKLSKKIDTLLKNDEETKVQLNEIRRENYHLAELNEELVESNHSIKESVKTICRDRVIHTDNPNDCPNFVIIQNNPNKRDYQKGEIYYQFSCLRIQKGQLKSRLRTHTYKYPNCKIILTLKATPNAIILWANIKNKLAKGATKILLNCKGNNFDLKSGVEIKIMLEEMRKVNMKKYKVKKIEEDEE